MEQVRRDKNEVEINLADVFQILLSKWVFIMIAGLAAALAVGLATHFFIKKKYSAHTTMYVFTTAEQNQTGSISYSELNAADNLIRTYQVIVKSNSVLDTVANHFNEEHPEYAALNIQRGTLSGARLSGFFAPGLGGVLFPPRFFFAWGARKILPFPRTFPLPFSAGAPYR